MFSRDDAGPMLFNILLIVGGVVIAVWISTLSVDELRQVSSISVNMLTIVLAQPGVFVTFKIAKKYDWTWKRRLLIGFPVFVVLALAVPVGISMWLSQYMPI